VGLGALGGSAASLTRWICSWKRRTLSKLERLQIEYTSRKPSPSLNPRVRKVRGL
jgi:hypothetical protein